MWLRSWGTNVTPFESTTFRKNMSIFTDKALENISTEHKYIYAFLCKTHAQKGKFMFGH